jgi:hypothetical protein
MDLENEAHEALAESRARVYVGRYQVFHQINAHINSGK